MYTEQMMKAEAATAYFNTILAVACNDSEQNHETFSQNNLLIQPGLEAIIS